MDLLIFAVFFPAYMVGRYFVGKDPGEKETKDGLLTAGGFGFLSIVATLLAAIIIINAAPALDAQSTQDSYNETFSLLSFIDLLVHASIEEIAKFVPLAFLIYSQKYFNELTDGILYFAIVGLTFGSIETLLYSVTGGGLVTVIFRYGIGLFLHAALTAIVGYSLARMKFAGGSILSVIGALALVSLLHTLYNVGATIGVYAPVAMILSGAISAAATSAMFILYYKAAKQDFVAGRAIGLRYSHDSSSGPVQN